MEEKAPRNRTLTCDTLERDRLTGALLRLTAPTPLSDLVGRVLHQDMFATVPFFPQQCVDLLVLDPPYNLTKNYNGHVFKAKEADAYSAWFEGMLTTLLPTLKPTATVYVCSDWRTSTLVAPVLQRYLVVRNRITWEREKGRGAKANWKNNTEDIWFATMSDEYTFNTDAVKLKRKVLAPYRHSDGSPKDWQASQQGNYRLTHPSNIWTDLTVPFWSMPENTDHPTQKPEKLLAKLILASSNQGDVVFDPCLGSGTTAVVANKLARRFIGIELNHDYACWALKRLEQSQYDASIQGYADGVFWERNTLAEQRQAGAGQLHSPRRALKQAGRLRPLTL